MLLEKIPYDTYLKLLCFLLLVDTTLIYPLS